MAAKRFAGIGQEVFVLSPEGEVVRTMIAKLGGNDHYTLLNGSDDRHQHWFSYEAAVCEIKDRINAQQTVLRKQLHTLGTQKYRDDVMSAPYRVVDLRDEMTAGFAMSRRTRNLKKVRVPETYFRPDHLVYAIITPTTRPNPGWEVYRPHKHFVLETEVASVCFSPDGQVHYTFSTRFVVGEFLLSREEAMAKLRSFSEPGTEEPVPFVSSKQEREENEKLMDDDIPF